MQLYHSGATVATRISDAALCSHLRACGMCGNEGATWVFFGWAESKAMLRCRRSQLSGEGRGWVAVWHLQALMLPANPQRPERRRTGPRRRHAAHMTTAVSQHHHMLAARGARGLPSAVGRGHIPSQSASLLLLVVLREVIHVRRRKANESQLSYQSISHRSHWEECSVLQKS